MDPMAYLNNRDAGMRFYMQAIAAAAREIRELDAHNLAVGIANKVGEMLGGE